MRAEDWRKRLVIDSLAGFEMALIARLSRRLIGIALPDDLRSDRNRSHDSKHGWKWMSLFTEFPFSTYSISFLTDDIHPAAVRIYRCQLRKIMV